MPDNDVQIVSTNTDMDFLILLGQILDEFVKINQNLKNIEKSLDELYDKMG